MDAATDAVVKLAAADADSPGMAVNRRTVGALCVATALAAAGAVGAVSACAGGTGSASPRASRAPGVFELRGTGSASPRASRAPGVFELRVAFRGKWGSYFGPAHEWYSPRTGVFRVQGSTQGKAYVQVFDGSAWTTRHEGRLERQAGRPAMFRWLFARPDPLSRPGAAAVDSFLGQRRSKLLRVVSGDGGRVLDGEVKLEGSYGGLVRFRVRVVRRLTFGAAGASTPG
jgi:hypothetical protein